MSEAWFGRRLAKRPPAYRWTPDGSAPPRPACPVPPEQSRAARPGLTRPAGIVLIIAGAVLLLAVSVPLSFLNLKLLGLILVIAGLVTVRALQRASGWLWRNRREVMTALDAPRNETAIPRVPLDMLLAASPPAARRARRRARRQAKRQAAGPERPPGAVRRLGRLGRGHGQLGQRRAQLGQQQGQRPPGADQLADAGERR